MMPRVNNGSAPQGRKLEVRYIAIIDGEIVKAGLFAPSMCATPRIRRPPEARYMQASRTGASLDLSM